MSPIRVPFPDPRAIRVKGGLETLKAQIGAVITGPVGSWSLEPTRRRRYFDAPSFMLVHEVEVITMVGGQPHDTSACGRRSSIQRLAARRGQNAQYNLLGFKSGNNHQQVADRQF